MNETTSGDPAATKNGDDLMLNRLLPGWVPKWVLLGVGLSVAYLAAWFGENYAPLVTTGIMPGLQVLGYSVTPDMQMLASEAIWVLTFAAAAFTGIAIFGYVNHFLQGKINTRPDAFQIFFLMLVLCACMIGFGAWQHPIGAWSSNPWLWYRSKSLMLGVIVFPSACLTISLVIETLQGIFGPSNVHAQLQSINAQLAKLSLGAEAAAQIAATLDITRQADGTWKHPATKAHFKLQTVLEILGAQFDQKQQTWVKPASTVADALAKIESGASTGDIAKALDGIFGRLKSLQQELSDDAGLNARVNELTEQLKAVVEALNAHGVELKRAA